MFIVVLGFMWGTYYSIVREEAVNSFIQAVIEMLSRTTLFLFFFLVALVVIGGISFVQLKTVRAFVGLVIKRFDKHFLGLKED